jgi:hypothetical protein
MIKLVVKGMATRLDIKVARAKEGNKDRGPTLIQRTSSASLKDIEINKKATLADLKISLRTSLEAAAVIRNVKPQINRKCLVL